MVKTIEDFFSISGYLPPEQISFRPGISTKQAMESLMNQIHRALENNYS